MRKNFLILFSAVSLLGMFSLIKFETTPKQRKKVLSVSSEDIIQQQIDRKVERRKNGYSKPADKPDKFVAYKQAMKSGFGKAEYAKNYKVKELKSAIAKRSSLKRATADLPWVQRGPGNIGGRTRAIVVDHSDATQQTWFAGAVSGGIWKTSDAGSNWELVSPDITNMSINCMAMAPTNANVIYAGTGEGYYNLDAVQGNGIYKSIDNGVTWNPISKTTNTSFFHYVNSIVISPSDENVLYVATNKAVTKSSDGGDTWSNITPKQGGEGRYQRLIMHPSNENILWVALNNKGVFKSTDAGESWFQVLDLSDESRIEIMVSEVNPDLLFALNQDSKLYYSSNGGEDWAECVESSATEFLGGQGWYNNVIAGHPTDENKGFIGGIDFYSFTLGSEIFGSEKLGYSVSNGMSSIVEMDNFYGSHENGGLKIYDAYSEVTDDIEIQFGSGVTQMVHRLNSTSYTRDINVDLASLSYNDYVEVPFKVVRTDGTISTQLDASFIDSNNNGVFDLTEDGYEVIVVHNYTYTGTVNATIVENNGNVGTMVALYPQLVDGAIWDEGALPTANIAIDPIYVRNKNLSADHLTVWHSPSADNYSHADHHNITILEGVGSPFSILVGNDGGLFYSADAGVNWDTKSKGYITTQFYGIARHPQQNIYFGGMQDNGSYLSPENASVTSAWEVQLGGDGFDVVWHSRNADKIIGSVYYNDLSRSLDGGESWYEIKDDIGDNTDETAPFLTKIASSKVNPDLLFVGGKSGLWRSENFGTNWNNIPMGSDWGWGDGGYPKIAISDANPDIVWAGIIMNSDGAGGYTTGTMHVSTDGGNTFSSAVNAMDLGAVSNIITHPNDANTAYLLFSYSEWPKIFKTTDLGQTWEDISGFNTTDGEGIFSYGAYVSSSGFPNVAVNTMLVMPFDENELWAGTEIGLFISYDGGESWALADNGIPAVSIWDMKIVGDEIVVGTHGLGVWTVQRTGLSTVFKNPYLDGIGVNPGGNYTIEVDCSVAYDQLEIYADDVLLSTKSDVGIGVHQYNLNATELEAKERIRTVGYVGTDSYSSNSLDIPASNILEVKTSYSNTFSQNVDDFFGNGFAINGIDLNNNNAIVTDHPYPQNIDLYYTLKYPITVSSNQSMAFIKYQDIAFVETGENGVDYPDTDFYDYVVVQATKDGVNWIDLAPGYDFNYNSGWSAGGATYSDTPEYTDYVEHNINLWDNFNAGDDIIIRFKLHSDPYEVGWGWAIDNLRIQEDISSIFSKPEYDFNMDVYPNPTQDKVNIRIEENYTGNVKIIVYAMSGDKVNEYNGFKESRLFYKDISLGHLNSGTYIVKVKLDNKQSSKVLVIK